MDLPAVAVLASVDWFSAFEVSFLWGQEGRGVQAHEDGLASGCSPAVTEGHMDRTGVDVGKWCLVERRWGHSLIWLLLFSEVGMVPS